MDWAGEAEHAALRLLDAWDGDDEARRQVAAWCAGLAVAVLLAWWWRRRATRAAERWGGSKPPTGYGPFM